MAVGHPCADLNPDNLLMPCGILKDELVVFPVLSVGEFLQGLVGLQLCQLIISSPLGLKPCLADLYRKFISICKVSPQTILVGFAFEELVCLVTEFFAILDEFDYCLFIGNCEKNVCDLDIIPSGLIGPQRVKCSGIHFPFSTNLLVTLTSFCPLSLLLFSLLPL